jgi:hypothetical protein
VEGKGERKLEERKEKGRGRNLLYSYIGKYQLTLS